MKKLILILTLFTTILFAEETDIKKYNFYWDKVPAVCAKWSEIERWAEDKGFTPINKSNGRENGKKDGKIVYMVIYWMNDKGETFASVQIPQSEDVCILFRTFDLSMNPLLLDKLGINT
tara:strand:+ start:316 stop:672 length:357 start_codon:yes stop_codon:yes gene_type:complete